MACAWYEMRQPKNAAGEGEALPLSVEVFLYDEIGYWGTTAKDFADDLRALGPVKDITVRINSGGGEVFAGIAIHNLLKSHPANITVIVDGIAASIASVIAMAGDKIIMPSNAMMMIHNPSWGCWGEEDDLREVADVLAQIKKSLVASYRGKTKMDDAKISDLMAATTWMTAAEAKEMGFCDEVTEPVEATAFASVDASRFAKVPDAISAKFRPALAAATPAVPAAPTPVAANGDTMSGKTPAAEATKPTADTPAPGQTEADIRAQLAAEAEAKASGTPGQKPGESPEAMAERLRAEAAEITDLCEIAGCPKNAAGFIRKGLTPQAVRAELLKRDVAAYERTSTTPLDTAKGAEKSADEVAKSWDHITAKANAAAGFVKK